MSKIKGFLNGVMYFFLALVLFFQVLGLVGTFSSQVAAIKNSPWLIPAWITAVYLIGMAVPLCKAWKKREKLSLVPFISAVVGTVLAIVVALTLGAALKIQVAATNISLSGLQGLNGWRLFWRHYSLVAVGAITAVISFMHYKRLRDDRIREENANYKENFSFDEDDENDKDDKKSDKKEKKLSKKERKAKKKA